MDQRAHQCSYLPHKCTFSESSERFKSSSAFKGSSFVRLTGDYEASQSSIDLDLEGNKQVSSRQDQDKDECFLLSLTQKHMQKLYLFCGLGDIF